MTPMTPMTQSLVMGFLGAVMLRISISDIYLRYVAAWMRWPILLTGVILVALAVRRLAAAGPKGSDAAGHHEHDAHPVPFATWLALVPGLVMFVATPPALGAYLAERRATTAPIVTRADNEFVFLPLPASAQAYPLSVAEFTWRSVADDGATLVGRVVSLKGFVSRSEDGWYVTELQISCCAADAQVSRVLVDAGTLPSPERDSWVVVEGTWLPGSGAGGTDSSIVATRVSPTDAPADPYA